MRINGMVISTIGIVVAIAAVGCGDSIMNAQSTAAMLAWLFASCGFLAVALILCAIGANADVEEQERENRKVKRVPTHSNEWRGAQ